METVENVRLLLAHRDVYPPYRGWSPEKVQQWEQLRLGYVYRRELELLSNLFRSKEETIGLDIACGTGRFAQLFHGQYVGLDHSPSMLKSAWSKGIGNLVLGDAFSLPFRQHVFSTVLFFRFTHHLDPQKVVVFFEGVLPITKPKGVLVFDLTHRRSIPYLIAKAFRIRLVGSDPREIERMFVCSKKTRINAFFLPAISYNFLSMKVAKLVDALFSRFFPARSFWRVGS